MYNFTTETILNDLSKVKYLIGGLTANSNVTPFDPGVEATKKVLFIERLNKFIVAGTDDAVVGAIVYKKPAQAATLAQSRFTVPTPVAGTLYRVGLQITTNGYADGQFARDRVLYGKPFYVEAVSADTNATNLATALAAAFNKTFESYDNFVTASTSTAALIFTSDVNPFIQFKSIIYESIDPLSGVGTDITPTITVNAVGRAPFGDYTDLVKSHRLPTLDNYRPYGLNQEELPVVGATYDQYTLEYQTARGTMDISVVGGQATSKTSHIFWVNTSAPTVTRHTDNGTSGETGSYTWEQLLDAVGLDIWDIEAGTLVSVSPATEA
jgi:hypothetical protein